MTRGFILGKFLPPHNGHLLLCEFARQYADEVSILVCALDEDPIPGALRKEWMQKLCPWARVSLLQEVVPQEPKDDPNFWNIWRQIVKNIHPTPIDFVFASEEYGLRLAKEVGAVFVPVDIERKIIPVSGTKVRTNPYSQWQYLPLPVREYYTKIICLFGPESSGKTTLAKQLADEFETVAVPEYGRAYTAMFGNECSHQDLVQIAKAQTASILATRRYANKLLIADTDTLLTSVWAQMLLGETKPDIASMGERADMYLLTDIDIPWENDGTRYFPDATARGKFYDLCREALNNSGQPFAALSGGVEERRKRAREAIIQTFPELFAQK